MASEGPNSPGSAVNVNLSGSAWADPGNVLSEDGLAATTGNIDLGSDYLRATGFSFAVPAGATIDGVTAEFKRSASAPDSVYFQNIELVHNGSNISINQFDGEAWPDTPAYRSIGGAADLWGATLTPEVINSATFGVQITAIDNTVSGVTASVDHVRVTVWYTGGEAPASQPRQSHISISIHI